MPERIAAILVRSTINVQPEMRRTLSLLRLQQKNHCVIRDRTPATLGMLAKVKDLITWGDLDPAVEKQFAPHARDGVVRLQPPRGGYGRKGIKAPFTIGGALGYRGAKINDLMRRMMPSW